MAAARPWSRPTAARPVMAPTAGRPPPRVKLETSVGSAWRRAASGSASRTLPVQCSPRLSLGASPPPLLVGSRHQQPRVVAQRPLQQSSSGVSLFSSSSAVSLLSVGSAAPAVVRRFSTPAPLDGGLSTASRGSSPTVSYASSPTSAHLGTSISVPQLQVQSPRSRPSSTRRTRGTACVVELPFTSNAEETVQLSLRPGDLVEKLHVHPSGWTYGRLLVSSTIPATEVNTMPVGWFPESCLARRMPSAVSNTDSKDVSALNTPEKRQDKSPKARSNARGRMGSSRSASKLLHPTEADLLVEQLIEMHPKDAQREEVASQLWNFLGVGRKCAAAACEQVASAPADVNLRLVRAKKVAADQSRATADQFLREAWTGAHNVNQKQGGAEDAQTHRSQKTRAQSPEAITPPRTLARSGSAKGGVGDVITPPRTLPQSGSSKGGVASSPRRGPAGGRSSGSATLPRPTATSGPRVAVAGRSSPSSPRMGPGLSSRSSLASALKLPRSLSQLLAPGVTSPLSVSPRTRSPSPEQRPVPPPQLAPRREAPTSADGGARKQQGTRSRASTGSSFNANSNTQTASTGSSVDAGNGKRRSQHPELEQFRGRHEAQQAQLRKEIAAQQNTEDFNGTGDRSVRRLSRTLRKETPGKDEAQPFVVPRKPRPSLVDTAIPVLGLCRPLEDGIETSPQPESPTLASDYEDGQGLHSCVIADLQMPFGLAVDEDEELELARKALEDSISAVNASELRVAELQKAWEDGQAKEEDSEAVAAVPSMCGQAVEEEGYPCSSADPVQLAEDLPSRWQQLDAAAREQLVRMLTPVGEDGKVARAG